MQLGAVLGRKAHVSQDVVLALVHQRGQLGQPGTELVGDMEEGLARSSEESRRCIFLTGLYRAEQAIADRLRTLTAHARPWPEINAEKAIPWVEAKTGLVLAASQRQAVQLALASKVLVITGGPGVGKTTLLNAILKILITKQVQVALCAPTGRAAKRLAESTGLDARTIHRLLEADPRTGSFKRDQAFPLACDLLVLDEASMVDAPLMRSLLRALPDQAALLVVGDADQLPSVGPGQVLADIIASGALPAIRLTEFPPGGAERVIRNAHRINRGQLPELDQTGPGSDFYFVEVTTPEEGAASWSTWCGSEFRAPSVSIRSATSRCYVR